ncbi:MAG: hypothetical protein ACR2P1_02690 [Pseudomonadales bacterium]
MPANRFIEQIRRNLVALISLAIALSSLSYNTWRNEQTEQNRNVRAAGFEVLLKLGELERTVLRLGYAPEEATEDPRMGWAIVLNINAFCDLLPASVANAQKNLFNTWKAHSQQLEKPEGTENSEARKERQASAEAVGDAIDKLRVGVQQSLHDLR